MGKRGPGAGWAGAGGWEAASRKSRWTAGASKSRQGRDEGSLPPSAFWRRSRAPPGAGFKLGQVWHLGWLSAGGPCSVYLLSTSAQKVLCTQPPSCRGGLREGERSARGSERGRACWKPHSAPLRPARGLCSPPMQIRTRIMAHSPFSFKNRHLLGTSALGAAVLSCLHSSPRVFLPAREDESPSVFSAVPFESRGNELREGARAVP